ncbi:peritrophin-1-like isoform X1 [Haliotis rufescens]|uniref:peritrophin-1-like isoform X1 n=1 Tax=Haliotis rufescens TaxID=6454 RepID=UPI001EB0363C|nr:peritrophin-1-like isoform X1 [Haliotis rufescens]XP_046337836.1 peritrophin-1-like isoform X1 [Haliotis rufescens]XP_046337839.1 peritrophin-1-like isoform X1 [Haliotis rufescens]
MFCTSDRLHRFTCQTGQLFNPRTGSCDKSQNVQCHVVRPAVTPTSHQLGGSFCVGKPDNFYPSPDSCDHYYICANQSAIQATCPYGLLYSPTKQYCDLRSRVSCLPGQTVPPYTTRALPSRWLKPTTATSKPTQLPASTSSGKSAISTLPTTTLNPGTAYSSICRNQPNSLMAAPGTCRKYIQCYYQMAVARTCPTGTAFNKMIQACDFPYKVPGCH